jgi:hypothetical protein
MLTTDTADGTDKKMRFRSGIYRSRVRSSNFAPNLSSSNESILESAGVFYEVISTARRVGVLGISWRDLFIER